MNFQAETIAPTGGPSGSPFTGAPIAAHIVNAVLDRPLSSRHLFRKAVERLGEAVEQLNTFELRIDIGPSWFTSRRLSETERFIEQLNGRVLTTSLVRIFASFNYRQFGDAQLRLVERLGLYSAFAPAGRELRDSEWLLLERKLKPWSEAADRWRIHRPIARLALGDALDILPAYQRLIGAGVRAFDLQFSGDPRHIPSNLERLFEHWIREDNPNLSITMFAEALQELKLGVNASKFRYETTSPFQTIEIGANGDYTCFRGLASGSGNLENLPIEEWVRHPLVNSLRQAKIERPEACRTCCWWAVCGGGELIDRLTLSGTFAQPSRHCSSLDGFYSLAAGSLIKAGMPPSRIAAILKSN